MGNVSKQPGTTNSGTIVQPPPDEVARRRSERKAKKLVKAEAAKQKERDCFTEGYLAATANSYTDYLIDRYILRPNVPPSGRLHPASLGYKPSAPPEKEEKRN